MWIHLCVCASVLYPCERYGVKTFTVRLLIFMYYYKSLSPHNILSAHCSAPYHHTYHILCDHTSSEDYIAKRGKNKPRQIHSFCERFRPIERSKSRTAWRPEDSTVFVSPHDRYTMIYINTARANLSFGRRWSFLNKRHRFTVNACSCSCLI